MRNVCGFTTQVTSLKPKSTGISIIYARICKLKPSLNLCTLSWKINRNSAYKKCTLNRESAGIEPLQYLLYLILCDRHRANILQALSYFPCARFLILWSPASIFNLACINLTDVIPQLQTDPRKHK